MKLYTQGLVSEEEIESWNVKDKPGTDVEPETEAIQSEQIKPADSISECIERLKKQQLEEHLIWVQDILLELCSIKLGNVSQDLLCYQITQMTFTQTRQLVL